MSTDAHAPDYELIAANFSPVALLVLSSDGAIVRHTNRTFALLVDPSCGDLIGRPLTEVAPDIAVALEPLLGSVAQRGRPVRMPGIAFGTSRPGRRRQLWDAACAPLPPDPARLPPETVAVWLWPEESGAVSSRQVAEALREGLQGALPTVLSNFEVSAALVPSEPTAALGGDTYDVVRLSEHRWALLIADVAGRGPAAAARAVMVRHSARVLVERHGPGEVLSVLSHLLLADPTFTGFVTAFLGVVDTRDQTLTFAVAGHDPALLLRGADGIIEELMGTGGIPLAVDAAATYPENATSLTTRDILLLYTDGLTDTRHNEDFYDLARVRAALLRHRHLPAPALVASLLAEAGEWAGDSALRDDTAVLALRGRDA